MFSIGKYRVEGVVVDEGVGGGSVIVLARGSRENSVEGLVSVLLIFWCLDDGVPGIGCAILRPPHFGHLRCSKGKVPVSDDMLARQPARLGW